MVNINGTPFVEQIIAAARAGGGFVEYFWDDPTVVGDEDTGSPKVSYALSFTSDFDFYRGQEFTIGAGFHRTFRVHGRTLVVHEQDGYGEWGLSGSLSVNPGGGGHGLSFVVRPSWGGMAPRLSGLIDDALRTVGFEMLERLRVVARGATRVSALLNRCAAGLAEAGRLGIFTPMYFTLVRKPGKGRGRGASREG